jgi:5-methylcytosine-specific restriction endonuclease McrA
LNVTVKNKPTISFHCLKAAPLFAERFKALIQLNSQTLVRRSAGAPDRHIPREVRRRVWQRYSGKCADCGAVDYLEFDHIVPVAKGGSNSDQNVQLLCRKCNLQKSDKI